MSTRRARIKAVAALPPRRKIADNVDSKKKQEQVKEAVENILKSPQARSTSADKNAGKSPAPATLPSPRQSPRNHTKTSDFEKVYVEQKLTTSIPVALEKRSTTPIHEKNEANKAGKSDFFVSPRVKASPLRRRSPVARTPVIDVDISVERSITPHKRLLELQESANRFGKIAEKTIRAESPKSDNDAGPRSNTEAKSVIEEYINSPNTPEATDVMDGIVPLKSVKNLPKPIDLLKSEIISENAEVLFDPIVPLPSPTKVRQKLRPVPRLGPARRNSVPGSASESEDESRRGLQGGSSTPVPPRQRNDSHTSHVTLHSLPNRDVSRVRNDSVCSSASQLAPQTPAAIGSPLKEKNVSKSRRQEVSRRMAALRRRRESVQRDKLTMYDLIFYNPLANPIIPDQDELKAKEANKKEQIEHKKEEASENANELENEAAPVPQIKIGPNGEIVLDEQSLVIKQSEQRKLSTSIVREGAWVGNSTGRAYRKTPRTADWTDAETVRFYRALAAIGTDFTLMQPLFPGRSRRDLKLKFKKEEKLNMAQIDKALRSGAEWNVTRLESEFTNERKMCEENEKKEKEKLQEEKRANKERLQAMKDMRVRQSQGAKALAESIIPENKCETTVDDFIAQAINAKRRRKVRNPAPVMRASPKPFIRPNVQQSFNQYATLYPSPVITQIKKAGQQTRKSEIVRKEPRIEMASLIRNTQDTTFNTKSPVILNALPTVPSNIEPGSLVVLTVSDPKSPSKKMLQTYISRGEGKMASISLPPNFLNSVVGFMQKDTPRSNSGSSPQFFSPSSTASGSRTSTPSLGSPNKRKRHSSYNITEL